MLPENTFRIKFYSVDSYWPMRYVNIKKLSFNLSARYLYHILQSHGVNVEWSKRKDGTKVRYKSQDWTPHFASFYWDCQCNKFET